MTRFQSAKEFAQLHLRVLAAELRMWQRGGQLPADGKFRELASLCEEGAAGDEYQVAEQIVVRCALDRVMACSSVDFDALWSQHGIDGESYDVARQWLDIGLTAQVG